jgi:hypothetical protein
VLENWLSLTQRSLPDDRRTVVVPPQDTGQLENSSLPPISVSTKDHNITQPQLIQQQLDSLTVFNDNDWGDPLQSKASDCLRVAFRNIHFLPHNSRNSRNEELLFDVQVGNFDIIGLAEPNVAWNLLPDEDRLRSRFKEYWEACHISASHNTWDSSNVDVKQIGGTLTLALNQLSYRVIKSGVDSSGLGCWSWIRFQGKQGITLQAVTVYRPVVSFGATSVYQQHSRYIHDKDLTGCPRDLFFTDLDKAITTWIDEGDQLIVQGDFNEDVRSSRIRNFFLKFAMHEAIISRFPLVPPNTYAKGRYPIDGIFVTATLQVLRAGYTPVTWGMQTDHRLLWLDLSWTATLGDHIPNVWRPKARRLKLHDPRIVENYLYFRDHHTSQHQLYERVLALNRTILSTSVTDAQATALAEVDMIRVDGMFYAERKCRKLRMGTVP